MDLLSRARQEADYMNREIRDIDRQLKKMPEGSLQIWNRDKDKGTRQYVILTNGKKEYLNLQKDSGILAEMAYKKYLQKRRMDCCERKRLAERLIRSSEKCDTERAERLLADDKYSVMMPFACAGSSEELIEWARSGNKLDYKSEERKYRSVSGRMMRSKSEASIDSELFKRGLFVRYDTMLQLSDSVVYPDFIIRSREEPDRIIYWEHFGHMDEASYINRTLHKLQLYIDHGIIPMVNLIITCETKAKPLDAGQIDQLIEMFFGREENTEPARGFYVGMYGK